MLRYIEDAGGAVFGTVWYQGESDCGPEQASLYGRRFTAFVKDLRTTLKSPRLPVLTVQLNRCAGNPAPPEAHDAWDTVREIQRQLARTIPGVTVTSTLGLGLADGVHNDSAANVVLGERMAACALGSAYGRAVKYLCPDLASAKKLAAARIELTFDNVDGGLKLDDPSLERFPIVARDEKGEVPVRAWTFSAPNRMLIKLARPIKGSATVAGGFGMYPQWAPPIDAAGYRPMLGFKVQVRG